MKRKGILAVATVSAAAVVLVAGAAWAMAGRPSGDVKPSAMRDRCFNPTFLRGYQTPTDGKLIIETDDNQAFELTMAGPCFDLDTTFAIGIRSRSGMNEVCDPFDADIVFRGDGFDPHRVCHVASIRHLQGDEAAKYIDLPHHDTGSHAAASHSN